MEKDNIAVAVACVPAGGGGAIVMSGAVVNLPLVWKR